MIDTAWFPVELSDGRLVWLEGSDFATYVTLRIQQFWGFV
jgi:hypothetical protein